MSPPADRPRILVIGEVLFDHFPDGRAVLGGAPFNVAWHLQGLGAAPILISRVGADPEGERVRRAMTDWGMDTRWLQTDPRRPTGRVTVSLEGGQPRFEILPDQAYDYVDLAGLAEAATGARALYHGSLLARRPDTARALLAARAEAGVPVFLDVNLRPPWWEPAAVGELLSGSRWVKLNDDELAALQEPDALDPLSAAEALRARYGLESVIVTRGAAGAAVVGAGALLQAPAAPVRELVDTVGAGDAFSAVSLLGLVRGWPAEVWLERALAFASRICEIRGAVSDDPSLYREVQEAWQ